MTTFVLIPGAGGDSWFWHLVVPRLEAAGFDVVSPDLPAADESAGLDEYARVVVGAVQQRRRERLDDGHPVDDDLVVVCQSLGGFTGVRVCEQLPVRLLVFVNAMIPAFGETAGEWWANTGQGEAYAVCADAEGRDPDAGFDADEIFFHDVPPEVRAEAFTRGEPAQSEAVFAGAWNATAWPTRNTRVIAGRHDRLFPLPFMQKQSRQRLGIEPDVVDAGHLSPLAAPDAVAALLLRYASESA